MMATGSNRLLSLDVMRGITIAFMILVNSPGSWSSVYAPLRHATWNGLTPTDLVFPFFIFIMGVSTCFSLRKFNFKPTPAAFGKIVKRTVLIFAIGLALSWFRLFCAGLSAGENWVQAATHFNNLRILGVLQRIALAYGFAAIITLLVKRKHIIWVVITLLVGYFLMLLFGNGFEMSEQNIISVVDRAILGEAHMYRDITPAGERIAFDPLGLLSTIPSIAHVLIGFLFGLLILNHSDNHERVKRLLILGTILAFSGLLLQYGCPINKKLWSPTYVLVTSGFAAQLLGLLIWIIDVKGKSRWSRFFHVFGVNPLILYVFSIVLVILLANIKFTFQGELISIHRFIYAKLISPWTSAKFGSLLFAVLMVLICHLAGYLLYRRKIFIKI
jgi:predicted acyltransferase